ncbi:MAG: hypothetical protein WCC69_09730 [Pirellulales bacterium]
MIEMVVNADQARLLTEARESVEIIDAQGNRLGFFARRFSDGEVAIALARAAECTQGSSTRKVLERLRSRET